MTEPQTFVIHLYEPTRIVQSFKGTLKQLYNGIGSTYPEMYSMPIRDLGTMLENHQGPDTWVCFGNDQTGTLWVAPMGHNDTTPTLNEVTP